MKWMISSAVMVAVALSVGVRAQSGGAMAKDDKMDKMETKTYTGCVAAGADTGTFTLTHVMADDHMGKDAMKKDAMKKDTMSNDTMSKDAMKKDSMGKDNMAHDTMTSTTMTVSSKSVDLAKHIGHKVTVTGSSGPDKMDAMGKNMSAFTVKSLKMVSASCS
jgi:pentapeptide MXKDX repeat protein